MQIRLADKLSYDSIVDGVGMRIVVWMQGCLHNCPSCHNPFTHKLDGGYLEDIDKIVDIIDKYSLKSGVTISGGDPFIQKEALLELVTKLKEKSINIWIYTGYIYEDLLKDNIAHKILEKTDVLIDGPFIEKLKNKLLVFKGSSNQRIIDVKKSLEANETILFMK